jgi:2-iminobutanoate/2-iminopropanoate deaminase
VPTGFETTDVWKARGRGFQMGVVQPQGIVVHLTGQVAWDKDEGIVGKGDIDAQTRKCLANIQALLAEVGGQMADIISITTYYTDHSQLAAIQRVRGEYFRPDTAPVSTSVMVAGLGHADFLIELTPVAVIPKVRFRQPERHVDEAI